MNNSCPMFHQLQTYRVCGTILERSDLYDLTMCSRGNRKFKSSVYFALVKMIITLNKLLRFTNYM